MSRCPACGYWAFDGIECHDCGYRPRRKRCRILNSPSTYARTDIAGNC